MNDQTVQYNIIYESEIFTKDILLLTSKNGALFAGSFRVSLFIDLGFP